MASVHIARWVDMDFMFNIGAGVGKGRANHKYDVMLIQYLLNMAMNQSMDGNVTTLTRIRPPDHPADLKMDGICGTNTQKFIDYYQTFRNSQASFSGGNKQVVNMQVKADGAIDPWKYPAMLNFRLGGTQPLDRTYTLVSLCYDAAKNNEFAIGTFHSMPAELQRVLCAH